MRADRIQQILQRLEIKPEWGVAWILDALEAQAPELTLEELVLVLRRLHENEIADRDRRTRQRF
jgi:hypothetical protein